jgi:hypothetical protein
MGTRRARAALRRTDEVRLRPTFGGCPRIARRLAENGFFSILLVSKGEHMSLIRIGDPAPDFRLSAPGNKEIGLRDFRGKHHVILAF